MGRNYVFKVSLYLFAHYLQEYLLHRRKRIFITRLKIIIPIKIVQIVRITISTQNDISSIMSFVISPRTAEGQKLPSAEKLSQTSHLLIPGKI